MKAPHLISADTVRRSPFYCQCEQKSGSLFGHLKHYCGEEIGLLYYNLAEGKVYTLHSAFSGMTGAGITIFSVALVGIEHLFKSKSFVLLNCPILLLFIYLLARKDIYSKDHSYTITL